MANQLLLIEDVDSLGRSGEVVRVKPGYARNYLLPQKKAVIASKHTLRMQAKLREERAKQAEVDRKVSEEIAGQLQGRTFVVEVKVDPDGHMYGSVAATDIVELLSKEGIQIERRNVELVQAIKTLGGHPVSLKLKEGVPASITLQIIAEGQVWTPPEEVAPEAPIEE